MYATLRKYKYHRELVEFLMFCLPNRHTPTHAGQAVNQNIAVLAKASAMYEVIAHSKVLCEILKMRIKLADRVCVWSALPDQDYPQP